MWVSEVSGVAVNFSPEDIKENSIGGFVGPYVIGFLTDRTGNYAAGIYYLVATGLFGGLLLLFLRAARPTKAIEPA